MKKIILAALLALFVPVAASAQGVPNAGGMVPNTPITVALGAGVYTATVLTTGTGYVPGDTVVTSIPGATTATPPSLTYLGSGATLIVTGTQVVSATIAAAGTGCGGSFATLTGTTGTGGSSHYFTATAAVSGGALTGPVTITAGGQYVANPTSLTNEPVTGDSCSGAQLNVVMGALYLQPQNPGYYTYIPSLSPIASQASTSGGGTGLTATVSFAAMSAYQLPQNQVSTTNPTGNVWSTAVGFKALNAVTTGVENTAFGWQAGSQLTTGGGNTAVGVNAMGMAMATGNNNTAIGNDSMKFTAASTNNTALGQASLNAPTNPGTQNVAIGGGALLGQTSSTGSSNVAVGFNALEGLNWTTGSSNVAIGQSALTLTTTASGNVAVGLNAGSKVTTGGFNIFLGTSVGSGANGPSTGVRNILIGTNGCSPASTGTNDTFILCASGGEVFLQGQLLAGNGLALTNNGTYLMPNITTDATHTDSTICQDTTTHQFYFGSGTLGICLGTSSARFKHDIRPLTAGIDQIMRLEPIAYRLNEDHGGDPNKLLYGFTAEQGQKALPELTGPDAEGNPNTFDYLGVVPVLVKGMQQLKAENDTIRACNDNWKCRLFGIKP